MIAWLLLSAHATPADDFLDAVLRMQAAVDAVADATFVLHQQEYVGGRLRDVVKMQVRYQAPNRVYVTWENGQRLLWRPGENGDKMRVDPGPLVPTISLAPDGVLAMRGQRHTIRRMGLAPVAALFTADVTRILADPERLRPEVVELAPTTLFDRPARCFDATMRKDLEPGLYGARVEVCFDAERDLPLRMRTWNFEDGEVRLVESYGYEHLATNLGLTDADFDPVALGL